MAVRHGYGKVAGTDALVFAYDTGDTVNSYKGEPTENLFPYPQLTNHVDNVVGAASITKKDFGGGLVGIEIIQGSTADIISFSMHSLSSAVSGATYTWSSYVHASKTSAVVKAQVTIYVDGVRHWLTNSNTWTTSVTECSHLFAPTVANQWHRVDNQFTMPTGTLTNFQLGGWYRNNSNYTLKLANAQLEINSHPTQFLIGTRSATQGLLDLTGNNSIDLTNAGFDSNAQLDFDGTNTYIPKFTDSRFQFINTDLTYEVVVNFNSNPDSYQTLIGLADTNDYIPRINFSKARSGLSMTGVLGPVYMQLIDQNGSGVTVRDPDLSGADLVAGGYYHYVGVVSKPAGSSTYYVYLYRNGVLVSSTDSGRATYDTTQGVQGSIGLAIGTQFGNTTSVLDGQLPVAKVYNRALTAGEVKNNYSHYKNRFGI
jgi:hypothetical protein